MSREGAAEIEEIVTRAIEREEEFDGELEIVSGPTAGRWIRWRGRADGGGPSTLHGVSFDVTEHRQVATALRVSEERFRGFAENSADVLWITDRTAERLEYLSPAFERVFGEPRDAIMADFRRWRDLVHPDDREAASGFMSRALSGQVAIAHYRVIRPEDGQVVHLRDTGFPIRDGTGTIIQVAGVVQDITDLARGRDELETLVTSRTGELMAAEAELRQSQKMEAVGQLTGGLAHDFNNMLQAIGSSLEMMRRRSAQGRPAEVEHFAECARNTVDRAAALTHQLLAFARRQTLQSGAVDADVLARGMAELIRRTVGPSVRVELRLGDGAWPVRCDPHQLESVLLNLAINARDAMPEGGTLTIATRHVHLDASEIADQDGAEPGAYVEVAVTDTGMGMDESTRLRAFEPFFTTKPLGRGTGLGLSQLYGFTRQSHGVVRLDSALGQGTTLRLYLPRHEPDGAGSGIAGTMAVAAAAVREPSVGGTVLFVDDETEVRATAAEHLRELGYAVLEANDGASALRVLMDSRGALVDALVTDVGLPGGLNGRQLADMARERYPIMPVLFVTGFAGSVLEGQLAPGMEVIGKPFTLDALGARVRAMIDGAGSVRA